MSAGKDKEPCEVQATHMPGEGRAGLGRKAVSFHKVETAGYVISTDEIQTVEYLIRLVG
jgi:hypothetical protein